MSALLYSFITNGHYMDMFIYNGDNESIQVNHYQSILLLVLSYKVLHDIPALFITGHEFRSRANFNINYNISAKADHNTVPQ